MVQIKWSLQAKRELREIYRYIAQDSRYYAQAQVEKIYRRVDLLRQFPRVGKEVTDFSRGIYREIIVDNYRVVYRFNTPYLTIAIVSIIHARRLRRTIHG